MITRMLAVAPLLFWAWLTNESPIQSKAVDVPVKFAKKISKSKMSSDKAMEIMLDHGFLPQLPALAVPAHIINVENSSNTGFQGVDFLQSGTPVILHFWATWCGPCKRELPHFAAFASSQDVFTIYTITSELRNASDDIAAKIWNFYNVNGISGLNVCADINNNLSSLLGVNGIPATFLISSDGRLLGRFLGATDWSNLELQAALVTYVK